MVDWLFEGHLSVTLLLAAVLAVLLWLWWKRRTSSLLLAAAGVVLVLMLYLALDRLVETDREQIRHRIEDLAGGVQARDLDRVFQYISEQFKSAGGRDKKQLRELARQHLQSGDGLEVWDITCEERPARDRGMVRVSFLFKVHSNRGDVPELPFRCEATFDFHPEQGWRLRSTRVLDPFRNNVEIAPQP